VVFIEVKNRSQSGITSTKLLVPEHGNERTQRIRAYFLLPIGIGFNTTLMQTKHLKPEEKQF